MTSWRGVPGTTQGGGLEVNPGHTLSWERLCGFPLPNELGEVAGERKVWAA